MSSHAQLSETAEPEDVEEEESEGETEEESSASDASEGLFYGLGSAEAVEALPMLPRTGALPDTLYRKRHRMSDGTMQIIIVRTMPADYVCSSEDEENAAVN